MPFSKKILTRMLLVHWQLKQPVNRKFGWKKGLNFEHSLNRATPIYASQKLGRVYYSHSNGFRPNPQHYAKIRGNRPLSLIPDWYIRLTVKVESMFDSGGMWFLAQNIFRVERNFRIFSRYTPFQRLLWSDDIYVLYFDPIQNPASNCLNLTTIKIPQNQ